MPSSAVEANSNGGSAEGTTLKTTTRVTTTLFPGKYIQGAGALGRLPGLVAEHGGRALVVCAGPPVDRIVETRVRPLFAATGSAGEVRFEQFAGEVTRAEIERLRGVCEGSGASVVVGIGGGKTIDAAKVVAEINGLDLVVCPTTASTDAPCSSIAIVYTPEGEFSETVHLRHNPNVVLMDTEVIVEAPPRFLAAGIGDALATWFEAESCQQTASASSASSTDMGSLTAYALARLCYDTLRKHGVLALAANEARAVVPAFERVVETNTLLSGLGFESGGLAMAHSVQEGLTALPQVRPFLHGEVVTIGVLASLFLHDWSEQQVADIFDFCDRVGLPTTLAHVGLAKVTDAELLVAANKACTRRTVCEPHFVSPAVVVNLLRMMDAYGTSRPRTKQPYSLCSLKTK
eukprot:m51a1_g2209 putative glycerol dehydrogenase (405) ;mRNA; r:186263-187762